jgi:hypothetical protein
MTQYALPAIEAGMKPGPKALHQLDAELKQLALKPEGLINELHVATEAGEDLAITIDGSLTRRDLQALVGLMDRTQGKPWDAVRAEAEAETSLSRQAEMEQLAEGHDLSARLVAMEIIAMIEEMGDLSLLRITECDPGEMVIDAIKARFGLR